MVNPPSPKDMEKFRQEDERKALLKKVDAPAPGNKTVPASTAARVARDTAKGIPGASAPKKKMALAARLKATMSKGGKAEAAAKKVMQSKVVNPGARGKGGSSGAAGSWLQWSGAKRGNN
jgi:hypothetical protein